MTKFYWNRKRQYALSEDGLANKVKPEEVGDFAICSVDFAYANTFWFDETRGFVIDHNEYSLLGDIQKSKCQRMTYENAQCNYHLLDDSGRLFYYDEYRRLPDAEKKKFIRVTRQVAMENGWYLSQDVRSLVHYSVLSLLPENVRVTYKFIPAYYAGFYRTLVMTNTILDFTEESFGRMNQADTNGTRDKRKVMTEELQDVSFDCLFKKRAWGREVKGVAGILSEIG